MARRYMTDAELAAAFAAADERMDDLWLDYQAAATAAKGPADATREAHERWTRARTDAAKAAAMDAERAARAVSTPLVVARDAAHQAYNAARERARELKAYTGEEWRRVVAVLARPDRVARLAEPCTHGPDGAHVFGIGHTTEAKAGAHGILIHCQRCGAAACIAETHAVVVLLDYMAKGTGFGLTELPRLAATVDE